VNEAGGINGRKVKFTSLDDGYVPSKTVELARQMVEGDKVFALFQCLGTPCNTAIHKYMNQKKVPQLYVATGASKWGDPKNFPWTMGFQPDYQTEAVIYAKHALANVMNPKIGILSQNDDFGRDYVGGLKEGLGKDVDKIVKSVTFEATDPTVDSQVIQLKDSGANVFFNIATPKFAAQAMRKAGDIGWKPIVHGNSLGLPHFDAPVATNNIGTFFWFMYLWIAVLVGVPSVLKVHSTLSCSTSWRISSTVFGGL
jgi:branched-chain amino acid transport system substrate-binding protein